MRIASRLRTPSRLALPGEQVAHQSLVERHPGMQRHVINASADTIVAVRAAELRDLIEIIGLDRLGVDLDRFAGLVVFEAEHTLEGKFGLGLIEDVKYDQVVPPEPQAMDGLQDRLRIAQKVAEDHDQAAVP